MNGNLVISITNGTDVRILVDESYRDVYDLAVARDDLLESIGNLTLVTRELNSKLKIGRFLRKKTLDKHSQPKLNREICENCVSPTRNEKVKDFGSG